MSTPEIKPGNQTPVYYSKDLQNTTVYTELLEKRTRDQEQKDGMLTLPSLSDCEIKQRDHGDEALSPIEAAYLRLHDLTSPGVGLYTGTDLREDLQAIIDYVAENSKAE